MLVGEEVFNAADGYDEDMWDDSVLIRNYERAYQASRYVARLFYFVICRLSCLYH